MTTAIKKPTLADVAELSGSHRNTVSKILKGEYEGDVETISKVLSAASILNYTIPATRKAPVKAPINGAPVDDDNLPEGASLEVPEEKCSAHHNLTLRYAIKVACEWEYDKDKDGNRIDDTEKAIGFEERTFHHCLSERPTLKEVQRIIAAKHARLPDAV